MFNQIQNATFNALLNASNSFASGSQGLGVVTFKAEGDLEEALRGNGFRQEIKQDKFGMYYGHGCWWNAEAGLLVCNYPGSSAWTIATEVGVLTDAYYQPPSQTARAAMQG